jgi:hypothetical protein
MLDNVIDLKQGFSRILSSWKISFYVSNYSAKQSYI